MKKSTEKIKEKIAFLESLQNIVDYAEDMRNAWGTRYDDGTYAPPTNDTDLQRWDAYEKIIAALEKLA